MRTCLDTSADNVAQRQLKTLWSERIGNELYVYWRGQCIYKRWYQLDGSARNEALFNVGWPTVWINQGMGSPNQTTQDNLSQAL